jgi:glutamate formiminotransferase/formiminotetrahydrofolate cyclodeaminase
VKALGLEVDGRAQVSMNLTDYTRTPLALVVERVREEAAERGASIIKSELVGLIPQEALVDAAAFHLGLEGFRMDQILEVRLQSARQAGSEADLLDRLAAATPTPGGGSAAAYAGAMAASLVGMVGRLTLGKKKYAGVEPRIESIVAEADKLRRDLQSAAEEDAQAFDAVLEAMRLPKDTQAQASERQAAIERATHRAADVPLRSARVAVRVAELAAEAARIGNVNALSDAASAGFLAAACVRAAGLNVRVNAQQVADRQAAEGWERSLTEVEGRLETAEAELRQALARGDLRTG